MLISATPQYFGEVLRLIQEMDIPAPQVVIQVLIAEVDLANTEYVSPLDDRLYLAGGARTTELLGDETAKARSDRAAQGSPPWGGVGRLAWLAPTPWGP